MRPLEILILSDDRPGHYHLAEGIAAAVARRRKVEIRRIDIERRRSTPGRLLAGMARIGSGLVLRCGYGLKAADLGTADLVVSAGGDTLAANVAAARLLSAANVFCGTLRHFAPEDFSLIVSSYARHRALPRHLVALKPSGIDPDGWQRTPEQASLHGRPPLRAGLLVGGNSGLFAYTLEEWRRLIAFLAQSHAAQGTRWVVSTSRRSPDHIGDAVAALAAKPGGPVAEFIDFRVAGPGTLPRLFAGVDAILATEDSSTMISEAVCARLPVVGVAPAAHDFKDEEREYRAFMRDEGWCRFLPLDRLSPETFAAALGEVTPLSENHLERLADALQARLPQLFSGT